jgi:hypothetical protein
MTPFHTVTLLILLNIFLVLCCHGRVSEMVIPLTVLQLTFCIISHFL